jgi:hypothetical protein
VADCRPLGFGPVIASLLAAAEPSKIPIYIAGGVFAAWAVILAVVGINRPGFPFGLAGQRAVMGVSATLAAASIAMAVVTSK